MEGEAVPSREGMQSMNRAKGGGQSPVLAPSMHVRLRPAQRSFALQEIFSNSLCMALRRKRQSDVDTGKQDVLLDR